MAHDSTPEPSAIIPQRCYRDAQAAITFLERAFGFTPSLVVPGAEDDSIAHAELWAGHDCLMVASIAAAGSWRYRVPIEIGGVNTGSSYMASSDIDALHARAVSAGATIVSDLADTDYGSRDFSARDPEGFLWHFGTYRPGPSTRAGSEPQLFCGMRYVDAREAIAWLGRAFGAVEELVIPGDGTDIAHAQLQFGESVFMLGSAHDDAFALKTPQEAGGDYTQTLNVRVADPDAHHARAARAGAQIVQPLADTAYGARGYVARDCEGYIWNFSTYSPAPPRVRARAEVSRA